jgi:hypothetical protein
LIFCAVDAKPGLAFDSSEHWKPRCIKPRSKE